MPRGTELPLCPCKRRPLHVGYEQQDGMCCECQQAHGLSQATNVRLHPIFAGIIAIFFGSQNNHEIVR